MERVKGGGRGGMDKDGTKLISCNQNRREGGWERERGRKGEKRRKGQKGGRKGREKRWGAPLYHYCIALNST